MSNIRPSVAPGEKTKFPRVHMGHMGREPTVEDEDIVDTLRDWPDGNVFPSTGTVTDELDADYDRKTVYRRLDKLEKAGEIEKIQVGRGRGKSVGWYAPEKVQEPGRPQEPERPSEGDNGTDEASPTEMDANTSGLSGRLSPPGGSMDLATVMVVIALGWVAGWTLLKGVILAKTGKEAILGENGIIDVSGESVEVAKGATWLFVAAVGAFVSLGTLVYLVGQVVALWNQGLVSQAVAFAGVLWLLFYLYVRTARREMKEQAERIGETDSSTSPEMGGDNA